MEQKELLECIDFFKELKVFETDVTSNEEKENHSKVVLVNYSYKGQSFTTTKLYYKNILHQDNVKNPQNIINYFGGDVYWLDKDKNDWAKGRGEAELEKTIIDEMVDGDDKDFKDLLKSIANNHKTGFIQRITAEGKSGQYHHNFENNNHWHDIILLIQEIINKKGAKVDKRFFSRLVFKWDGDKNTERERSSLAKEVELKSRTFIDKLYNNIKSIQNIIADMEIINILTQKKQIILQGPPGTGKTRMAKEIAEKIVNAQKQFSVSDIEEILIVGDEIKTTTGYNTFKIIDKTSNKVQVKPKNAIHDYPVQLEDIVDCINSDGHNKPVKDNDSKGTGTYKVAIAKYIVDEYLKKHENIKLIQFHPAYTYEDFVRGIVAESKGDAIEYKTKNKILAEFAKKANTNYNNSKKAPTVYSKEKWIENQFSLFVEEIEEKLESEDIIELTKKVSIFDMDEDAFRYKGQDGWVKNGNRMLFSDIKKAYFDGNEKRQDIKKNTSLSGLAHHHASYYIRVLDLFKLFLNEKKLVYAETQSNNEDLKYFVLIIDEINRANLPAVLGELIYALEYRGEKVDSMYATDEDGNTIIIPLNLYIIGTMNTSDRSVGHIDYAIRRRFAFIDVLPKVLEGDNFELELFKQVSALFIKNFEEYVLDNSVELKLSEHLSEEFRPEDVWLGHSYFIKNESDFALRKKYEIVPILKEYVKDGILKKSAEPIINAL